MPVKPHPITARAAWQQPSTHQLLEEVAHGHLVVPLLNVGVEGIVKVLVDLEDVLDLVKDGFDLLDGQDGLGRGRRGFQRPHWLRAEKEGGVNDDWADLQFRLGKGGGKLTLFRKTIGG